MSGFLIGIGVIAIAVYLAKFTLPSSKTEQEEKPMTQASETIKPTQTAKPKTTQKPTPTPEPLFEIVSGTAGDWEITVTDFDYTQAISVGLLHEYRANEGSKYCTISLTVKNIGKKAQTFLPYISYGNSATAEIVWDGYEYIRSELIWSDKDMLSNESLNPLVSASGLIVFEVPDEMADSDIPPVLKITNNYQTFSCELVKK